MYTDTIRDLVGTGQQKVSAMRENWFGFFAGAMMAGAYIGFGDIIMFSVSAHIDPTWIRLVSGAVFSAALTIVVFAGSELFTGSTMYMTMSALSRRSSCSDVLLVWVVTWLGNLVGAVMLAALLKAAGGGVLLNDGKDHFFAAVQTKISAPGVELIAKGILCNWLVCLAIWMCNRTSESAAKLALIFWPVTIFVSAGFEHSVANMFTFAMALMAGDAPISLFGAARSLLWVTFGNIVGGGLFVAFGYWIQEHGIGHEGHAKPPPLSTASAGGVDRDPPSV